MRILSDDSCLIRLGNIGKNYIHHTHKEPIVLRLTGVVDDGDDIGSLLSHIDQIPTHPVRKLDCIDNSSWADDVGNVRDSGPRGTTQVEDFSSRDDPGLRDAADHRGSDLRSVRVPHTVFHFLGVDLHTDALLVVDRLPGDEVLGHETVLSPAGHEHAR